MPLGHKEEVVQVIPVDVSRMQVLVVGEPVAQFDEAGKAKLDRATGRPQWSVAVTLISDGRADTVRLSLPEGGFPKELVIGMFIVPEGLQLIFWTKKDGTSGIMFTARSVKVAGGLPGLKSVAA